MTMPWHARTKRRGDDISDPISGEFFADGSLENPATALVREALQNALDAGKGIERGGRPVRVRIALHRGAECLSPELAQHWFGELWPHLIARGNGLKDVPGRQDSCDYLTIEDFGTSGLTGDIESDNADGARNNFVDFLRSDGRTRKSEGDRGSWGVGKNVFPRTSRINSFIAFTIRADDNRPLLLGKAILKIRRVGESEFQPPCYLGSSWKDDDVPRPVEAKDAHDAFRRDFRISRTNEPGLSLVVPWVDQEVEFAHVRRAVVGQYYYAILAEAIEVELSDGGDTTILTAESIVDHVDNQLPDLAPAVSFAKWCLLQGNSDHIEIFPGSPTAAQKWTEDLVPSTVREQIKAGLLRHERIAVRVPLHIRRASESCGDASHFDVYLEHHDEEAVLRPMFFREQLLVSGVKRAMGVPKIRSLVVIGDGLLADLLRAAEPPNHTDWDPKTGNFRKEFKDGAQVITFVKSAVKQLMTFVRSGDEEPDPNVTIDFFAVPDDESAARSSAANAATDEEGKETKPEREFPPPTPRKFSIRLVEKGFAISPKRDAPIPDRVNVLVAYDVLSGNPWSQFDTRDFDLTTGKITISTGTDSEIRVTGPNTFEIEVGGPDFATRATGFDPLRDLIVRAYEPGAEADDDSAPELHEAEEADA